MEIDDTLTDGQLAMFNTADLRYKAAQHQNKEFRKQARANKTLSDPAVQVKLRYLEYAEDEAKYAYRIALNTIHKDDAAKKKDECFQQYVAITRK